MSRITALLLAITACNLAHARPTAAQDQQRDRAIPGQLAVEWNALLLRVAEAEDSFLTLKGVRCAAMMHLAMHNTSSVLAASQAALVVATDQYPDSKRDFEALHAKWTNIASEGAETDPGSAVAGTGAAEAVLRSRANDGWNAEAEYRIHPMGPGVYAEFPEHSATPEGFVFGAGWATARPFVLSAPGQFEAPAPPDVSSLEYARAYNEVKEVGRFQSSIRTIDQTHIALWWKDFVENSHNRLARDLVAKERLDFASATRLFALLNMAVFDAYVNSFHNKFLYNHWRPYTAIRWADNDGNSATDVESSWTNTHRHTYAFPSYPSAHGMACAAAGVVLADTFGESFSFTMETSVVDVAGPLSGKIEMRPTTRKFNSFSDAAVECAMSRVYLGIHFRYDSIEGNRLGNRVGAYVVEHGLTGTPD